MPAPTPLPAGTPPGPPPRDRGPLPLPDDPTHAAGARDDTGPALRPGSVDPPPTFGESRSSGASRWEEGPSVTMVTSAQAPPPARPRPHLLAQTQLLGLDVPPQRQVHELVLRLGLHHPRALPPHQLDRLGNVDVAVETWARARSGPRGGRGAGAGLDGRGGVGREAHLACG